MILIFKVLIVDDEPLVLEGLKTMIDWQKNGFRICGEASDGEDAWELIKSMEPDLVVTDIRMPVIDGLQLIQLSSQNTNNCIRFIILSGHDDFSYARTALGLPVSNYLLKPIDPYEIEHTLSKLRLELEEEIQRRKHKDGEISSLIKQSISPFIRGHERAEVLNRTKLLLQIEDETNICCVLVETMSIAASSLRKAIVSGLTGCPCDYFLFEDGNSRLGIFIKATATSLLSMLNDLREYVASACDNEVTLYVSESGMGVYSLKALYNQTLELRNHKVLFSPHPNKIYFFNRTSHEGSSYEFFEIEDELLLHIENNDLRGIVESVEKVFINFSKKKSAPSIIQAYVSNLMLEMVHKIAQWKQTSESEHSLIQPPLLINTSLSELKQSVISLCKAAASQLAERQGCGSAVLDAAEFVRKNYQRRLKLHFIAKQLHVQPAYLGQLFRKTIGMSFNDYVHFIRIDEAKKLLRRTDMKIADIAHSVGYIDAEDFVGKFKALSNSIPSVYRGLREAENTFK